MDNIVGAIYILKNPSFPDYIKIGYADDVYSRLKTLNDKSAVPFAFRLYAYYKVNHRLEDNVKGFPITKAVWHFMCELKENNIVMELNDVFIDLIIDRLYREISNYLAR